MADSARRCFSCAAVRMPEARCRYDEYHRKYRSEEHQRSATERGWTSLVHGCRVTTSNLRKILHWKPPTVTR